MSGFLEFPEGIAPDSAEFVSTLNDRLRRLSDSARRKFPGIQVITKTQGNAGPRDTIDLYNPNAASFRHKYLRVADSPRGLGALQILDSLFNTNDPLVEVTETGDVSIRTSLGVGFPAGQNPAFPLDINGIARAKSLKIEGDATVNANDQGTIELTDLDPLPQPQPRKYIRSANSRLQFLDDAFQNVLGEFSDRGEWLLYSDLPDVDPLSETAGVYGRNRVQFQRAKLEDGNAVSLQAAADYLAIYGRGRTKASAGINQIRLFESVSVGPTRTPALFDGALNADWIGLGLDNRTPLYSFEIEEGKARFKHEAWFEKWLGVGLDIQTPGFVFEVVGKARLENTLQLDALTASRAVHLNANQELVVSAVTDVELGYLASVTSAIQTQLNGKAPTTHSHGSADISDGLDGTFFVAASSGGPVTTAITFNNGVYIS